MQKHIIFIVNLLQDVNVVRPLVLLAAADLDVRIGFLVSAAFVQRDKDKAWMAELETLCTNVRADLLVYDSPFAAYGALQGKHGVLVAGSESDLPAHAEVHQVFRTAPPGFLKVTLQHGFECIGFLQNLEQSLRFGTSVRFAADVVCGWCESDTLTAMMPSERAKLYVTGPQTLLQMPPMPPVDAPPPGGGGLVCENMHSVRFTIDTDRQTSFLDEFNAFCAELDTTGETVTLRPHPGGQYVLKNRIALPRNVAIENQPMYRVNLTRFDYGLSAPSTVVLDMVLAGLPVALWTGPGRAIDSRHYTGLRTVGGHREWLAFMQEAYRAPAAIRHEQADFLAGLRMPTDPAVVRTRFARLLAGAGIPIAITTTVDPFKVLFVANDVSPSLTISFLDPLDSPALDRPVESAVLTEKAVMQSAFDPHGPDGAAWIAEGIAAHAPDLLVLCRYSGPHAGAAIDAARALGIPTIYHLDDDLLHIPMILGARKHALHNAPKRIASVTAGLENTDLIYCSTGALGRRIADLGFTRPIAAGAVYCTSEIRRTPVATTSGKIGYMGSDHAHDLEPILPGIVLALDRNPGLSFEIFGSTPKPAALDRFGDRITIIPPIRDYDAFQRRMDTLDWDVGICPLLDMPFNMMKADTKWVDYTAVGVAVVASAGTVYDRACGEGCGILATDTNSWADALERLCTDGAMRREMVLRAQEKLERDYAPERLRAQVLDVFDQARAIAADRATGDAPAKGDAISTEA